MFWPDYKSIFQTRRFPAFGALLSLELQGNVQEGLYSRAKCPAPFLAIFHEVISFISFGSHFLFTLLVKCSEGAKFVLLDRCQFICCGWSAFLLMSVCPILINLDSVPVASNLRCTGRTNKKTTT